MQFPDNTSRTTIRLAYVPAAHKQACQKRVYTYAGLLLWQPLMPGHAKPAAELLFRLSTQAPDPLQSTLHRIALLSVWVMPARSACINPV